MLTVNPLSGGRRIRSYGVWFSKERIARGGEGVEWPVGKGVISPGYRPGATNAAARDQSRMSATRNELVSPVTTYVPRHSHIPRFAAGPLPEHTSHPSAHPRRKAVKCPCCCSATQPPQGGIWGTRREPALRL